MRMDWINERLNIGHPLSESEIEFLVNNFERKRFYTGFAGCVKFFSSVCNVDGDLFTIEWQLGTPSSPEKCIYRNQPIKHIK